MKLEYALTTEQKTNAISELVGMTRLVVKIIFVNG